MFIFASAQSLFKALIFAAFFYAAPLFAQPAPKTSGDYAADLAVVREAQAQALGQATALLAETEDPRTRAALEGAIKEMERSQSALDEAADSPGKLPGAIAAQQAAYQSLLKLIPREFQVSRARNRSQGGGGDQRNQRQLDQLEMKDEENRYETERQAEAAQTPEQREQSQMAERLKQLAQRQQDLNERLRELQTALQAARTEQEREEIQRQLKRLRDEERQMLADVDELRQQLERSPNASSLAETREQLEQTRSDMERAAEEMQRESPSQALAAGTRAQESMQNLREDLRRRASSQFTEQMRQLRSEARDLARQQEDIARGLDALENGGHKSLDDSAERQRIAEQMVRQEAGLTNLLAGMRAVTEQSENTEPLLSQKLYDTLRRADQMRTSDLLDTGAKWVRRGFLPQASEMERAARTNINDLRQGIERAAASVLGSEADALRFAQKEIEDLARQVEREMAGRGTNPGASAAAGGRPGEGNAPGEGNTNALASAGSRPGNAESPDGQNNSPAGPDGERGQGGQRGQRGEANSPGGQNENGEAQANANDSQRGQGGQGNSPGNARSGSRESASAQNQPGGEDSGASGNPSQNQDGPGSGQRQANREGSREPGGAAPGGEGERAGSGNEAAGRGGERERLRRFAEQLGGGGGSRGGPITGGSFVDWSDRLRDVERVLDPADLRNQLASVRERLTALRSEFRQDGRVPEERVLQDQILAPMTQVRVWLQQELARHENANSLVPLDRDPVPENYSELVRKYYEKLGSAQ